MRRISPISWILIAAGIVFAVVAVIYLTTTANNIPSFFPGHVHLRHAGKYTKRGIAAIFAAVVCFIIAVLALRKD